jgi:hypothetical protein
MTRQRSRRPLTVVAVPPPDRQLSEHPDPDDDFVFARGDGPLDLTCGYCGRVLASGVGSVHWADDYCLVCPECTSYNIAP